MLQMVIFLTAVWSKQESNAHAYKATFKNNKNNFENRFSGSFVEYIIKLHQEANSLYACFLG